VNRISLLLIFIFCEICFSQNIEFKKDTILMHSPFEIILVDSIDKNFSLYYKYAIEETTRIENLLSAWKPTSQISFINKNAGIKPVKVDEEVIQLIQRSIKISKLTEGAFDISWAGIEKLWKFDGSMKKIPSKDSLLSSVRHINYKNIEIDPINQTVFLKNKGMKLGLDGITQGYIADKLKLDLQKMGCISGLINVSGDIAVWGKQINGNEWKVAIKNPFDKNKIFAWFDVKNRGVETSGTYEKYILIDGKRYSHIINPRTGMPSEGIVSITVFAPNTEMADALATGLLVMGKQVALNFVNQIKFLDCIIIDDKGDVLYSNNLKNIEIKNK